MGLHAGFACPVAARMHGPAHNEILPCRAQYVPKATKVQGGEVTLAGHQLESSLARAGHQLDIDSTSTGFWHSSDASLTELRARSDRTVTRHRLV